MSALSCDEVEQRLPSIVVGDLTTMEEHDVDAHCALCEECARDVAESRTLAQVLDRLGSDEALAGRIEAALPLLRERLIADLPRSVSYDRIDSPLGPLYVVVSDDGLCGIHYDGDEEDFVAWGRSAGLAPVPDPPAVRPVVSQLREYFAGERTVFDLPVDLSTVTPFARTVLEATARVPFGRLVSYRTIAQEIGKPGATRAVGNALGSNPVPIVVPCHRVIRSDGSLGGYTGGVDIKQHLLKLEGALLID